MSTKRRVEVSKFVFDQDSQSCILKICGEAVFHQFVVMQLENDDGVYSVVNAIIEWSGGKVEHVDINEICFLDSEVPHEQS
jgi:hypothetical protein